MESKAKAEWKKENTIVLSVRLNKRTDADIIEYLSGAESKLGEIKRLIRIAMETENK